MNTYEHVLLFVFFDKVNFKMKINDEMMLGIRSCRRGQEQLGFGVYSSGGH